MIHSRRVFLRACGVVGLGAATAFDSLSAQSRQDTAYADPIAADEWMKKWMNSLGSAVGTLHVGRFADPVYYLLKEIEWKPEPGQKVPGVRVPVGFVTDFASIPRAFWALLPSDGLYTYPAILHDYLYWDQKGSRADADLTLRYAMEEFKVGRATMDTIYTGVRVGGHVAWGANASLKVAGEQRVLKQFPTDPTTPWRLWKNRPVF
jgi:Protein of unknown function (DUF1353)